jgi:hypothetical protein
LVRIIVIAREMGRTTMKKQLSTLLAATAALCIGIQSASAGLLGMPLNLKAAIVLIDADGSVPSYQHYADVLTGLSLVESC